MAEIYIDGREEFKRIEEAAKKAATKKPVATKDK